MKVARVAKVISFVGAHGRRVACGAVVLAALLRASPLAADSIILGPDCGFSADAIRCRFEEGWTVFVGRVVTSRERPGPVLPKRCRPLSK